VPDHTKQELLDGQKPAPTSLVNSPIGICLVDDPITFTHCTPCHLAACTPLFDVTHDALDESIVDYLLGLDSQPNIHHESSPTSTAATVPFLSYPIVGNTPPPCDSISSSPSHYIDDPIDITMIGTPSTTYDHQASPSFYTAEYDSVALFLSSPEVTSTNVHDSPPSITYSSSITTSFMDPSSPSPVEVSSSVSSHIRDVVD
ncbi:hypothetical protein KI387_021899, partial [Taxus chinensis]